MKKLVSFENSYRGEEDGNSFIAIDGFPDDENEEGEVVAIVWCTPHNDIVISWNNNAYRLNETVLNLIEESKRELLSKALRTYLIKFEDSSADGCGTCVTLMVEVQTDMNMPENVSEIFKDAVEKTKNEVEDWQYEDIIEGACSLVFGDNVKIIYVGSDIDVEI